MADYLCHGLNDSYPLSFYSPGAYTIRLRMRDAANNTLASTDRPITITASTGASCHTNDGTSYPDGSIINTCMIYGAQTCNTTQQPPLQSKCVNGQWVSQ